MDAIRIVPLIERVEMMGFDKAYPNRKDQRSPYYGAQACDKTCRPGGTCPWCKSSRMHAARRREEAAAEAIKEHQQQN